MSLSVDIRLNAGSFSLVAAFSTGASVTAVLGASGAGKTLALRAIAGLQSLINGEITQGSQTLYSSSKRIDLPARRRNIGYLFQDYALFPHLTVAENIAFGLMREPKQEQLQSIARMVNLLRLHGLEDRLPAGLSGGERQRVALGRALARCPDLLLLDEPFSALDAPTRESLVEEFIYLREAIDIPTVLVTHDVGEAYALAQHIVVMGNGRVLQSGTKDEVFHRPLSPDVARLVGVQNIFNDTRDGVPVIVGIRATDLLVESSNEPNATLTKTVDRGVQLLGMFTTSNSEYLVAEMNRAHLFNLLPGSRWRVQAREGASMVWPITSLVAPVDSQAAQPY